MKQKHKIICIRCSHQILTMPKEKNTLKLNNKINEQSNLKMSKSLEQTFLQTNDQTVHEQMLSLIIRKKEIKT